MKITTSKIAGLAGAVALACSTPALAVSFVDIGGLATAVGANFQVGSVYENVVTGNGQTLSGVGEVTQMNGFAISDLCAGCELTYRFGGLTSANFTGATLDFTGGWINFYLGFGANNDFNPFISANSAADLAAATNGTLFLTLAGHPTKQGAITSTLFANGLNFGTGTDTGTGTGLFDVDLTGSLNGNTAGAGAIANLFFDTNSIAANLGGPADFEVGSSFGNSVPPHPGECAGQNVLTGPECLAGSADIRGLVVPEPGTVALLGLGLLGFAASRRRQTRA